MESIRLKARAKINLGLDVLGVRENGYHDVRMVMQMVELYDRIIMTRIPEDEIRIKTNLVYLPVNENNLIYKAISLIKERYSISEGVEVNLHKFIPVAAGMAGGSTDAASALYGMNLLFDLGISKKNLMQLGVLIGADVPYCILRGTALAEGIGEKLTRLDDMPHCDILIAKPPINVSTKLVYEKLDMNGVSAHPDIDGIVTDIREKNLNGIAGKMGNVLENVTIPMYPVIDKIKKEMMKNGAINAMMSGSGPTVFGIFPDKQTASECQTIIRNKGLARQVYVTETYNK